MNRNRTVFLSLRLLSRSTRVLVSDFFVDLNIYDRPLTQGGGRSGASADNAVKRMGPFLRPTACGRAVPLEFGELEELE